MAHEDWGSYLGVVGAMVMDFSGTDGHNTFTSTRQFCQLCYVCDNVCKVYLSWQGWVALDKLDNNFHTPRPRPAYETATTYTDYCSCSCPPRSPTPPCLVTTMPAHIYGVVEDLKEKMQVPVTMMTLRSQSVSHQTMTQKTWTCIMMGSTLSVWQNNILTSINSTCV